MKKITKKIIFIPLTLFVIFVILVIVADNYILPNYVYAPVLQVPDITGKNKDEAAELLRGLKLNPIENGTRFDSNVPKDHIIFQRPRAGTNVKENRRVYYIVSSGDPMIRMPSLIGKSSRDAKITVERLGLFLAVVEKIRSEFPSGTIVEQEEIEGMTLSKGDSVHIKVSVGPKVGKVRVPNLLGEPLKNAEKMLRRHSLHLGIIKYYPSTLLPNTIIGQNPSKGSLLSYGDSVDVQVAKSLSSN